jgi:adsorption protein B
VLDRAILALIVPLAALFLLSGADDLAVDFAWLIGWWRNRRAPSPEQLARGVPPRTIAILVPLWKEHEVIGRMLEHNLAAIQYPDYHFFVGVYPNDDTTKDAVEAIARAHSNVHLALCPHDGPTSKADCLNWIYQHIGLYEERTGERFDVVVTHDAEDVIHPEALRWINAYALRYDFIQIPVLALATPFAAVTHGIYCDEFAEYHQRDMNVRSWFGCFVPGAGVGTGYRREALEQLARSSSNRVFEPGALTEDYDNGLRLARLGARQVFVPLSRARRGANASFVATREYFPKHWRAALRQRTRWVTGIALQGWERFGWSGTAAELYWLWRDRKGLIASPLGLIANAVFFYGLATAAWERMSPLAACLTTATLALGAMRIAVRMFCVARVYGTLFSLGVPVRAIFANALNASATVLAVARYAIAKIKREQIAWLKTQHSYPTRAALVGQHRRLGEVLVDCGMIGSVTLRAALASCPKGTRLGEHLVGLGELREQELYQALSLQSGHPVAELEPEAVPAHVTRALPQAIARKWRVLPFKIADGALCVASPELPAAGMRTALAGFTSLEIRFHLITPSAYAALAEAAGALP